MGRLLLIISTILSLLSCASSVNFDRELITQLENQGPVPVSASNPNLPGNELLAHETAISPELAHFINRRGMPDALGVEKPYFSPLSLQLYYPDQNEFYSLVKDGEVWLIRGPLTVPTNISGELVTLKSSDTPMLAGSGVDQDPDLLVIDSSSAKASVREDFLQPSGTATSR